jgi:hypothetical protein
MTQTIQALEKVIGYGDTGAAIGAQPTIRA